MYRQIVTPQDTQLLLQIPSEFVGKQVEVIAFTLETEKPDEQNLISSTKAQEIENFYRSINVKTGEDFKFNRDEAHER